MPLRNRVTPLGEIVAVADRGEFMGNRGILHNDSQELTRSWGHRNWVYCLTDFRNRKRALMQPNAYTELFFLDEVTALAAGHRPCGECQRGRYREFQGLMEQAHGAKLVPSDMDRLLNKDRLTSGRRNRRQRRFSTFFKNLPSATMVLFDGGAHLKSGRRLLEWSPSGYRASREIGGHVVVDVLTPAITVEMLRLGFEPEIHPSSRRL